MCQPLVPCQVPRQALWLAKVLCQLHAPQKAAAATCQPVPCQSQLPQALQCQVQLCSAAGRQLPSRLLAAREAEGR